MLWVSRILKPNLLIGMYCRDIVQNPMQVLVRRTGDQNQWAGWTKLFEGVGIIDGTTSTSSSSTTSISPETVREEREQFKYDLVNYVKVHNMVRFPTLSKSDEAIFSIIQKPFHAEAVVEGNKSKPITIGSLTDNECVDQANFGGVPGSTIVFDTGAAMVRCGKNCHSPNEH